ncbi:MAG: hypothetical protein ABSG57_09550 [Candidatus Bathyarchaeia archaeon]
MQKILSVILFVAILLACGLSVHAASAQENEKIRILSISITDPADANGTMVLSVVLASQEPISSVTLSYADPQNSQMNVPMAKNDIAERPWEADAAMRLTLKSYTQQSMWEAAIRPEVLDEKKEDAASVQQFSRFSTTIKLDIKLQSETTEVSVPQDYFPMTASIRSKTTPFALFQDGTLLVELLLPVAVGTSIIGIIKSKKSHPQKNQ